ncbi:voltage-dependent anion channel-domain-containing protein [Mycena rebaudengoi]|nr:voltage-dependent anion channel-domain-containing protein [Mycena rebaudengoi]
MSNRRSIKNCIRHFTWSWHTVVMGTGSVSTLISLIHFGENSETIKILTLLFFFNLCLFISICGATMLRYYMFPELWPAMLQHPAQSLIIGAFPMGAATLINTALAINQRYSFSGTGVQPVGILVAGFCLFNIHGLWDVICHQHTLGQMSALWLLPVVPLIVASSTGGLLAAPLQLHPVYSSITTAVSFTMLVMGLSTDFIIITVYLMRLVIHGPLDPDGILSSFLILGPLGQGGYSMLRVPFSIGYWGTIFPNGVFALLTVELGSVLGSPVLNYLGAIFSVAVFLLWIFVFVKTVPAVWNTSVFQSPCVSKLEQENSSYGLHVGDHN